MFESNLFNILDLLVMDHNYQKKCCLVLKDAHVDKKLKASYARSLVDTLLHHTKAEEQAVYNILKMSGIFSPIITESEVDHKIINSRFNLLMPKINSEEELDDETETELKVLSKFIENHLKTEEKDLFRLMKKNLNQKILNEMGHEFFRLRNYTPKDLEDHPELQAQLAKDKRIEAHQLNI